MDFKEALGLMQNKGAKVKLPEWDGYWRWDGIKRSVVMHCADGTVMDIRDTCDVAYTLGNLLSQEWGVATEENTKLLESPEILNFSEALEYLKKGYSMTRLSFHEDVYVSLIEPDISDFSSHLAIHCTNGNVFPFTPGQDSVLADDWVFADWRVISKPNK